MKLLFLDIDGVLNSGEFFQSERHEKDCLPHQQIDPDAVANLMMILLEEPSTRIVISSSWRNFYHITEIRQILKRYGVDPSLIVGRTPYFLSEIRGREIATWLHETSLPIDPDMSIVILDDDQDMGDLDHLLVRTSWSDGLTMADVDKAIEMLKKPFDWSKFPHHMVVNYISHDKRVR